MPLQSRDEVKDILEAGLEESKHAPILTTLVRSALVELKRFHPPSSTCAVCTQLLPLMMGVTAHLGTVCTSPNPRGFKCVLTVGHKGKHAYSL